MIKAIETQYNGYRFRSRLEARWAVFFDALGIRYEYEREGFEIPGVGRYLPDFWLPDYELWVEIKGVRPTEEELQKTLKLSQSLEQQVLCLWGEVGADNEPYFAPGMRLDWARPLQLAFRWGICSDGAIDILMSDECDWSHPRILAAYEAARSARFEFGETPAGRSRP